MNAAIFKDTFCRQQKQNKSEMQGNKWACLADQSKFSPVILFQLQFICTYMHRPLILSFSFQENSIVDSYCKPKKIAVPYSQQHFLSLTLLRRHVIICPIDLNEVRFERYFFKLIVCIFYKVSIILVVMHACNNIGRFIN